MMKLYAVRIENDETILVTAANPEEALERAGLPSCLLLQMDHQIEGAGASPTQRYKVVEVDHLHLRFRCTAAGDLNLFDADQRTYEWLFELHPKLRLQAMRA